jgi:hypothetical protein
MKGSALFLFEYIHQYGVIFMVAIHFCHRSSALEILDGIILFHKKFSQMGIYFIEL